MKRSSQKIAGSGGGGFRRINLLFVAIFVLFHLPPLRYLLRGVGGGSVFFRLDDCYCLLLVVQLTTKATAKLMDMVSYVFRYFPQEHYFLASTIPRVVF